MTQTHTHTQNFHPYIQTPTVARAHKHYTETDRVGEKEKRNTVSYEQYVIECKRKKNAVELTTGIDSVSFQLDSVVI